VGKQRNSKILIAVYSRTGVTREVAEALARQCGADVEEIRDLRDRRGLFGFLRSGREALRGVAAEIMPPTKNARDYDMLILGAPVWAGHVSSPMRGYLAQLAKQSVKPKHVAFFCTMGGSGAEALFDELSKLTGVMPSATLALTTKEVKQHLYADRLTPFVSALSKTDRDSETAEGHLRLAGAH